MNIYELTLDDIISEDFDKAAEYMEDIIFRKYIQSSTTEELYKKGDKAIKEYTKEYIENGGSLDDIIPDEILISSFKEYYDFIEENGLFTTLDFLPYKGIDTIFAYMGDHIWGGNKKYSNILKELLNKRVVLLKYEDYDNELTETPEDYGKGIDIIIKSFKYKITNKKRSYKFSIDIKLDNKLVRDAIITYIFKNDNEKFNFYNIDNFKFKIKSNIIKEQLKIASNFTEEEHVIQANNRINDIYSLMGNIIENRFMEPLFKEAQKNIDNKEKENG